jgi:hypothetical protein
MTDISLRNKGVGGVGGRYEVRGDKSMSPLELMLSTQMAEENPWAGEDRLVPLIYPGDRRVAVACAEGIVIFG